jgi:endoglucanase
MDRTARRAPWLLSGGLAVALAVACSGLTASISQAAPQPAAVPHANASLLPPGPLHTDGNQIVDENGNPVRIASVGWYDAGEGNDITSSVAAIVADGFNTVRLPWDNSSMNDDLSRFDQVVQAAGQAGLRVILDDHSDEGGPDGNGTTWQCNAQQANGLWYDQGGASDGTNGCGVTGTVTDATFVSDWQSVAQRYAGNDTVIGYDLRNEPLGDPGQSTWGDGSDTDIRDMYQRVGDAIQSIDSDKLIITEGRISCGQNNQWNTCATDLSNLADPSQRITLSVPNKLVYSVHEYPGEISAASPDSGSGYVQRMNQTWGFLESQNIAPVWIGEMGASMNTDDGTNWAATIAPYLNGQDGDQGGPTFSGNQQPLSTDWWCWGNYDGGAPNGTLDDSGNPRPEQYAVYSQFQFQGGTSTPSCPESANDSTVTSAGPTLCDASGDEWAIAPDGSMTENGQTVQYSANVIELAYVNGVIWQENSSDLWWGWTDNAWNPTYGTTTSPLG